ncbi:MAG: hypothetical protein LBF60_05790 [Treponema sp.]|jgi:hypothetical protein|nr:hypothetical protein [Treponema sp.]
MILVGVYEEPRHSNSLLVRGVTAEREHARTDMRPVATAKFTYRIVP